MAGIGFELRKVMGRGGIGSFLRAAFAGIMIVAGPWILSVIGINIIQRLPGLSLGPLAYFAAAVIYCYAWSLFLFGGFHFLFTRIVADKLYEKKEGEAAGAIVFFGLAVGLVVLVISFAASLFILVELPHPRLFRAT